MIRVGLVIAIREMANRGWPIKRIALELGVARNTARRYLRQPVKPGVQIRPAARKLTAEWRRVARERFRTSLTPNAVLVYRALVEQGLRVSARTVRRIVADVRTDRQPRASSTSAPESASVTEEFERWEFDLMRTVARRRRVLDHDELESELTLHLANVQRFRARVRDWKAFLITALNRKADNWIRNRLHEARHVSSLDQSSPALEDPGAHAGVFASDPSLVDRATLEAVRRQLAPGLKRVWDALIQENFNKVRTARRLHVHRNTVRNALRRIATILKRHGY